MRVAMVSEHASPLAALGGEDAGGQNVHVASLAYEMGKRGVDVTVYTRRDDPRLPKQVTTGSHVTVHHVDAGPAEHISKDQMLPYMKEFAAELRRVWRRDRPDAVHAHFWMSGLASIEAARQLSIPVVQTFHALGIVKRRNQGDKDTSPRQRLAIEDALVAQVDHIIATCTDEIFELVRLGADLRRISRIPCGVDLATFRPDGPVEPRRPGLQRIVAVSRLVERKGVGNVIEAIAQLPGVELLIAGGGDADIARDREARRLTRIANELGVADRVHLLGPVGRSEVPKLMRSADIVVSVPWYEPFGIVPLEAMACGVPVVVSAIGGLIDTVVDEVTGLHVPPRDPDTLARALAMLLNDERLRRELGAAGVQRARRYYGWPRIARLTLQAYTKLLGRQRVEARMPS